MVPIVDVVMPVHNGERFLGAAVDSILGQTLTDIELIVVDDASSDRTAEILDGYAMRDRRVRVVRLPEKQGVVKARNAGMRLANAPFIAVMDADDVSVPQRLETQVAFLQANPDVGVLGAAVQLVDEEGTAGAIKRFPTSPGLTAWSLFFYSSIAHPTAIIRREVVEALGGYAEAGVGGAGDFELFARASRITRITNSPQVLLQYRKWGGNLTRQKWHTQESFATRVVQDHAFAILGEPVSESVATGLRGLVTSLYPTSAEEIDAVGATILQLRDAFTKSSLLTDADVHEVTRDAAIKIWLLAALSLRRSPVGTAKLGWQATRLDPLSGIAFATKAAGRLAGR